MPNINEVKNNVLNLLGKPFGEFLLHTIKPNEFEMYLVALEIRDEDSKNNPKELLVFPVNPDSMFISDGTHAQIAKTLFGVSVTDNSTFYLKNIAISGSFGRELKPVYAKGLKIKTGYGVNKYLKKIFDLSKQKNQQGKPYRTIFYNFIYGENYTVVLNSLRANQTMESNRIWKYDLEMTAVAPADITSAVNYSQQINNLIRNYILISMFKKVFDFGKNILEENII